MIYPKYIICSLSLVILNAFSETNSSLHETPFPLHPELHVQVKDPAVLLQVTWASQLLLLVAHLFRSVSMENKQQRIAFT